VTHLNTDKQTNRITRPLNQSGKINLATILVLLNSLLVLGALGLFVYTKILYKRPPITEETERAKLALLEKAPEFADAPGIFQFEPITVNLKPSEITHLPQEGDTNQLKTKMHFATISIAIELRDINYKGDLELIRPYFLDKLILLLAQKSFNEMTNIQGRYILKTEIIQMINQLMKKSVVTNIYFGQFTVQ